MFGMARRSCICLAFVCLLATLLVAAAPNPGHSPTVVAAAPPDTTPPVANAGPDQTVNQSQTVTFDGSGSTDNVGIVNYTWTLPAYVGPPRTVLNLSVGGSEAAFDPVRPYVYVLEATRVDAVNLSTGAIDRTFAIDHTPQYAMHLAISPGGTYLAVSIPTGPRGYYYFGPYDSFFMSVNLATQTRIGEFFVAEDAYSVAVSDTGRVVIAGGSGQWAGLHVYYAQNGTPLPQTGTIWQYNFLGMHPSSLRVYGGESAGISTMTLYRWDFDPKLGITNMYMWPYWGSDPGGAVFLSPDGRLAITGSGMVLALTDNPSTDMTYVYRISQGSVTLAAFDSSQNLIAVASGSYLSFFDGTTYAYLGGRNLSIWPEAIMIRGENAFAFGGGQLVSMNVPRQHLYGVTATCAFADVGTYAVTLTVRDAAGNAGSDTMNVTVRDSTPPVAVAGANQTGYPGTWVTFDGWMSTDNVGVVNYTWTFNDGGPQVAYGLTLWHRFDTVGTYVITLTVRDAAGNQASNSTFLFVMPDTVRPVAYVSVSPGLSVYKGTTVTFYGNGTDNVGVVNYTWTFNDGGPWTLYGPQMSHRFDTAGNYPVTLTVFDAAGNAGNTTVVLNVYRDTIPPSASAFVSPSGTVFVNETVTLDARYSYDNIGIVSYMWTFTDNGPRTLTGALVTYAFQTAGNHPVTLTVADAEGNQGVTTISVSVRAITLATYAHPSGFSIGVFTEWSVTLNYSVPSVGVVDLVALGPIVNGFRVNLFVLSENRTVTQSDAFLLSEARAGLQDLRSQDPTLVVESEPVVIAANGTRVAVFRIYLPYNGMRQVYAVAVSQARSKEYVIVGSSEASTFAVYLPLFNASIRSFALAPSLSPAGSDLLLVMLGILAAVAIVGAVVVFVLWSRARVRVTTQAPPVGPGPAAPLVTPSSTGAEVPRFCPRCGVGVVPPFQFCAHCGQPLSGGPGAP